MLTRRTITLSKELRIAYDRRIPAGTVLTGMSVDDGSVLYMRTEEYQEIAIPHDVIKDWTNPLGMVNHAET